MKLLPLLLGLIIGLITSRMAYNSFLEAKQYQMAYESMQGAVEALQRTIGAKVDPAYVCRKRP